MKKVVLAVFVLSLTACNTVTGTMVGAGKDLQRAGEWLEKNTSSKEL